MRILVIESGSKGNATLVINEGRILLIDMGITITRLKEVLESIGKNIYNIDAMLLTHEHSDHTKGIKYLPPLTIYTLKGTYDGNNVIFLEPYKKTNIAGFEITPVKTSHDVTNPTGWVIKTKNEKLVYITDTGIIPTKTLRYLKNANYYIFESNHDEKMLEATNRPYILKRRILSECGHLSNTQSATYLSELVGDKTKEIILAHLSEEANSPKVALKTHKKIYKNRNISLKGLKLRCANQHELVEVEGK